MSVASPQAARAVRTRSSLADLPVGATGTIAGIDGDVRDPVARRLADLGFLAGTPVTVVRRAPVGDPTVFRLRSYQMCLRRKESDRVIVEFGED